VNTTTITGPHTLPGDRSQFTLKFFERVADRIKRDLNPRQVLDVGCGPGLLVEALRNRGVQAWGVDPSERAIGRVRTGIRPYCRVAPLTTPIHGDYDLITCINILEYVSETDARICIQNLTAHTHTVLFSANLIDLGKGSNESIRPVLDWLNLFADCNFVPDVLRDASFVSPQAFFAQHSETRLAHETLMAFALAKDRDLALRREQERNRAASVKIAELEEMLRAKDETLEAVLNSRGWQLLNRFREVRDRFHWLGRLRRVKHNRAYQTWIRLREQRDSPDQAQVNMAQFQYRPTISVLMPVYNTPPEYLEKAITSVRKQYYPNWQLCICDDGSRQAEVRRILEDAASSDPRIKVAFSAGNEGIVSASNKALQAATSDFVAFLDHDDELTADALYEIVRFLQEHPEADFIYSDEDKLELTGERSDPFFKPDWSPELMLSCMYTCHLAAYRKQQLDAIGGLRPGFDGSQDYDLALRVSERTDKIFHIPKVLYHWRKIATSVAGMRGAKPYAYEAAKRALAEHVQRRGLKGEVLDGRWRGHYRVRFAVNTHDRVSIIIPTRDKLNILKQCIDSIEKRTKYSNYEILVVDNGSLEPHTLKYLQSVQHRVIRFAGPFNFSKLNNFAVTESTGKYLLFLNNDTEVISTDWIEAMLEFCQQPEIGAVGAKLLYPNNRIQHAGVVLGLGSVRVAGHVLLMHSAETRHCFGMSCNIRNYSAVTAACMMMRREVFEQVGGFDEGLAAAYNDVDLCLRIRGLGLRIVWTPHAQLYHHESASRGPNIDSAEVKFMQERWGTLLVKDPYYNPNLTLKRVDFSPNV
jgi:GT2 family glycosyltransferase/SAM-dependent methyltransferase